MVNNNIMKGNNMRTILGVMVVVAVIAGAGFYLYSDIFSRVQNPTLEEVEDLGYEIEELSTGSIEFSGKPDVGATLSVPDLDRLSIIDQSLADDAVVAIKANITKTSEELKKNPDQFELWVDLGIYRKIAGDYSGAVEVWEYAGAIRPQNSLSFRNLGDLYGYYLKDAQKAEANLLKAIELDPSQIEYYFKTAEFYRDVVKDIAKARATLEQGIEANPDSEDLKSLLASL